MSQRSFDPADTRNLPTKLFPSRNQQHLKYLHIVQRIAEPPRQEESDLKITSTMSTAAHSAWKIIPQFKSTDIPSTIKFYTEELHFSLGGTHPDPPTAEDGNQPTFCSVFIGQKADANIYFFKLEQGSQFTGSSAMIALGTRQLDDYYTVLMEKGTVKITRPIADMEWGYRQFTLEDNDGNSLTFFRFLEGGNPGDGDGGDASILLPTSGKECSP
ncbi:hypothetical protein FQN50_004188 [Emmonsiellopsis sp. PD_5]|nr:hypothetical protein FQN50_004188 [Emmonsiellopsis sp. PD_5]